MWLDLFVLDLLVSGKSLQLSFETGKVLKDKVKDSIGSAAFVLIPYLCKKLRFNEISCLKDKLLVMITRLVIPSFDVLLVVRGLQLGFLAWVLTSTDVYNIDCSPSNHVSLELGILKAFQSDRWVQMAVPIEKSDLSPKRVLLRGLYLLINITMKEVLMKFSQNILFDLILNCTIVLS